MRRALRDAADRVGVERATPHMLRHSIASLLYERGWTDVQVAALLGHEDPSFTRSRYLHVVERGDVSVLDDVLEVASSRPPGHSRVTQHAESARNDAPRDAPHRNARLQQVPQTTRDSAKRSVELVMKGSPVRVRASASRRAPGNRALLSRLYANATPSTGLLGNALGNNGVRRATRSRFPTCRGQPSRWIPVLPEHVGRVAVVDALEDEEVLSRVRVRLSASGVCSASRAGRSPCQPADGGCRAPAAKRSAVGVT